MRWREEQMEAELSFRQTHTVSSGSTYSLQQERHNEDTVTISTGSSLAAQAASSTRGRSSHQQSVCVCFTMQLTVNKDRIVDAARERSSPTSTTLLLNITVQVEVRRRCTYNVSENFSCHWRVCKNLTTSGALARHSLT